jgi:hypothetical protein
MPQSDNTTAPRSLLVGGRRRFLKTAGGAALAAGAAPLVTSCGLFSSGFQVNSSQWLDNLANMIGAELVNEIVHGGLRKAWAKWGPGVDAVGEDILEDGAIAAAAGAASMYTGERTSPIELTAYMQKSGYRYIPQHLGYVHPVPPMAMLRASKSSHGDPKTDLLVVFVDGGHKHIVFKPWAWQTLSLFVNYLTANQSSSNLAVARAVCVLTLIPSGTRPQTGTIPGGMVDFYNYDSRNGNVKLALVQESNGAPTGVITASAIPGGDGLPLVQHFTLPNQAPGTV